MVEKKTLPAKRWVCKHKDVKGQGGRTQEKFKEAGRQSRSGRWGKGRGRTSATFRSLGIFGATGLGLGKESTRIETNGGAKYPVNDYGVLETRH